MKTIDYYASIAEASQRMVHAARASDWDALVEAEEACAARIAALQDHQTMLGLAKDGSGLGTQGDARRRMSLMSEILAHDAEVRELTTPWLRQLEQLLAGVGQAGRGRAAYGAG